MKKKVLFLASAIILVLIGMVIFSQNSTNKDNHIKNDFPQENNSLTIKKTIKIDKNSILSIDGKVYHKDDFPKEYHELTDARKQIFLSKYLYNRVVLDSLLADQERYKKEIDKALKKKRDELLQHGAIVNKLQQILSEDVIKIKTIVHQKILKKHKNIDKEIADFYEKNKKGYNYPNTVEIAHITVKNKKEASEIINTINDINMSIESFSELAKKHSLDNGTKFLGGYIGKVGKKEVGEEFFSALWKSNEQQVVSKPLKKEGFYHIVYIFKKYKAHQSTLEAERESIENYLLKKEEKKWLKVFFKNRKKAMKVEVYDINVSKFK